MLLKMNALRAAAHFFVAGVVNWLNDAEVVRVAGRLFRKLVQVAAIPVARHLLLQRNRRWLAPVLFQLRKHGLGCWYWLGCCDWLGCCWLGCFGCLSDVNVEPLAAVLHHVLARQRFQVLELHRPLVAVVAEHFAVGVVRHDDVALRRGLAHVRVGRGHRRIRVVFHLVVLLQEPGFKCVHRWYDPCLLGPAPRVPLVRYSHRNHGRQ